MSRLAGSLRYRLALIRLYGRNAHFAQHDYEGVFCEVKRAFEQRYARPVEHARLLEIGCGQRFGVTLLFASIGASVIGIDSRRLQPKWALATSATAARHDGLAATARSAVRHVLWDREYYEILESCLGRPLDFGALDVRTMDAHALEFDDASFDFVFSNAVLEHVHDVDAAVREIRRVLVPGGLAHLGVHLFPSLSGGHAPDWAYPDERPSTSTPRWDHLRDRTRPPSVYLNELRGEDYSAIYSRYFSILDTKSELEGERLLTDEISRELSGFSREDLLTRRLTAVLQRD